MGEWFLALLLTLLRGQRRGAPKGAPRLSEILLGFNRTALILFFSRSIILLFLRVFTILLLFLILWCACLSCTLAIFIVFFREVCTAANHDCAA